MMLLQQLKISKATVFLVHQRRSFSRLAAAKL
ncbi:hypothetical protein X756_24235 [Mesorhizobium sp. LSHC412B00]|nr:hypothetical protein X756_24235 [Mesorhizobium sp. LSHC412B00]